MGLMEREEVSKGGPHGSTWGDEGDSFTLQNHAAITVSTTTPGALPAQTITRPNQQLWGGEPQPDAVPYGDPIQMVSGFQLSNGAAAMVAGAALSFYFRVARNIGLATAIVGGVQISSITTYPLVSPIPSGASIFLQNPSGNTQTVVTSAAVQALQTFIPITPVTPANAYPIGTPGATNGSTAILIVGGLGTNILAGTPTPAAGDGAFGWYATALFTGNTGTPAIAPNITVVTPALLTNAALIVPTNTGIPYLPMQVSDNIQVFLLTSTSTAVVQILNCQPLLV